MMQKLPPIPTPPGAAFREFRIVVLPALVFAVVLVLTVFTWRNYVGPSQLVGEVESVRSEISSPQSVQVLEVHVGLFQKVSAGQPLMVLLPTDPRVLAAKLELSHSRLSLMQQSLDARLRTQNYQISYLQLRMSWMKERASLASLQAQQGFFRSELARQAELMVWLHQREAIRDASIAPLPPATAEGLAGTATTNSSILLGSGLDRVADYQIAKRDLDSINAQVDELTLLVSELEQSMLRLQPEEKRLNSIIPSAEQSALDIEERELSLLETQLKPISVTASIDGVVSRIAKRPGENAKEGDVLVTLSGLHSERVIAYLRQPLNMDLRTNMTVEIRSRSHHREAGLGRVLVVGTQMEAILPQLLSRGASPSAVEYGLPVLISLPTGLGVVGGEVVDLYPSDN